MRKTDASSLERPSAALTRFLRLAAVSCALVLVIGASVARAQEKDDDDEDTFEEKIIRGIMTGLGGTNMENTGIDYRERSPLVLPPRIDLPAPATSAEISAPNWPKDIDGERRKAAAKARRNDDKDPRRASRVLMPNELSQKGTARETGGSDSVAPGNPGATAILSPSQLGFTGGLKSIFSGSKEERAEFKAEPTRDSLTMPPPGYQTPSPNYAYGTGPRESLNNKIYNPSQGKYGD